MRATALIGAALALLSLESTALPLGAPFEDSSSSVFAALQARAAAMTSSDSENGTVSSVSPDILTLQDFNQTQFNHQVYVANGYIGARLPIVGMGFQAILPAADNPESGGLGWPELGQRTTTNLLAGFYAVNQTTLGTNIPNPPPNRNPAIAALPTWTWLALTVGNDTFLPLLNDSSVSNFTSALSVHDGIAWTALTWSPADNISIDLNYTVIASRAVRNLGLVHLNVSGLPEGAQIVVSDVLDGQGALRTENGTSTPVPSDELPLAISSQVSPGNRPNVTAVEISTLVLPESSETPANVTLPQSLASAIGMANSSTIYASYPVNASEQGTLSVWKAVGIASTDAFPGAERSTALAAAKDARNKDWDTLVAEHRQAWDDVWSRGGSIEIHSDGPFSDDLRRVSKASLFHLLANSAEAGEGKGLDDNAIAPAGLSSNSYAGLIFWDDVTWMYPGLTLLFPSHAKTSLDYRVKLQEAFRRNAREGGNEGLIMPWVNGVDGACSPIGPCYDYQYHLGNDVTLAMYQYYQQTLNETYLREEAFPFMRDVAAFWASHLIYNATTDRYDHLNESSSDEFSSGVNNTALSGAGTEKLFDNLFEAARILNITDLPANWTEIPAKVAIPYANSTDGGHVATLEYEGFSTLTPVKQADVVLLTYPLESPRQPDPAFDAALYSTLTSSQGPGMTWAIYSAVAAQVQTQGCEAFSRIVQSFQPYERFFGQFSEQQDDVYSPTNLFNPAYNFLTGSGGFLQTLTNGLSGFRFRTETFRLDPSLPPQMAPGGYTLRGVRYHGSILDVAIDGTNTTVSHLNGTRPITVEIAERNAMKGNYTLEVGQNLTVPTTRLDLAMPAFAGNIAQCKVNITSPSKTAPGNLALAAFDGSNATYWRPETPDPAWLVVDLDEVKPVKTLHFNLYSFPPAKISVAAGESLSNLSEIVPQTDITVTAPYDAAQAGAIRLPVGNTTDFSLEQAVMARYLNISVEGVLQPNGTLGGTIAEIAVLSG